MGIGIGPVCVFPYAFRNKSPDACPKSLLLWSETHVFLYEPIQLSALLWSETHMYLCAPIQCGIEHVAPSDFIWKTQNCDRHIALMYLVKHEEKMNKPNNCYGPMKYGNPWQIINKVDFHQVKLTDQLSFQSMFEKRPTLQEAKSSLHQTQQWQPVAKPERSF